MDYVHGKNRESIEIASVETQILNSLNKNFKWAIINMFKEVRKFRNDFLSNREYQ